ncbi:MAG TPA: PEPxxWA-CTERM sorting domain-containing protein, partial [Alphaproteobacteria bacterium]|nr:PEPxxWA-CTERM sorting domain-containing protein [Alphaproteobacteria bacterium]
VDVDAEVPPTTYDIASPVTFDFNPQTPNGEFSFYVDVRGARPDTGPDAEAKLLIQSLTVDFSDGATPPTDPPPVDPPPSGGEPPITGVPEPAAWAMLVLGFGGLGAVLRRQRGLQALA